MDALYRALLRLLPRDFDRSEMWETYRARVARAGAAGARWRAVRERATELVDLVATVIAARWPLPSLDSLAQDIRHGLRSLHRCPSASALAVLSLALGIGATTTMYGAADVWLFKPLPLPNGDRLVSLWKADADGRGLGALSPLDYWRLARARRSVEPMGYGPTGYNLSVDGRSERIAGLAVTANAVDVLGLAPILGRGFAPEEGTVDGPRVALLTEAYWTRAFGTDPAVVGRSIVLDDVPHTVIGVLPAGQGIPGAAAAVWTPVRTAGEDSPRNSYLRGVALLPPGVDLDAARAEMDAVAASVAAEHPSLFPRVRIQPLREEIYDPQTRQGSAMLLLAALFVLLIACANIANILLARGVERRHELAVRGALGAGRGRLMQQLFVEAAVLGVLGAAAGLLVGRWGMDLLVTYVLPDFIPGRDEIALSGRVLVAAATVTGASLLLFGLLPAVRASAPDVRDRLAEGVRGGVSRLGSRLHSALMIGEIAATLTLVVLTGLTFRAFTQMRRVDMGMRTSGALVFRLDLPPTSPPDDEGVTSLYARLDARLAAIPGVSGTATSSGHILSLWSVPTYTIPGRMDESTIASAELRSVTTSYRTALQLEMLAGRWLDDAVDVADAPPVAVVSEALARRWFDEPADALGATIRHGDRAAEIVGVVAPGRLRGPLDPPPPAIFEPFAQEPSRSTFHVLVHSMDEAEAVAAVRAAVAEVSPGLAVFGVATIQDEVDEAMSQVTAGFQVFGALGLIGLLLTLGGVYGVVSHAVGRRRHEMGVRMALGAGAGAVVRMMVWRSGRLALVGVAIGLALSLAAGRAGAAFLYGIRPGDPAVLAGVSIALLGVVGVASWLPARGAARVDPVETLKAE